MKKLIGLQWARAIAAVMVVVTHAIVHPSPAAHGAAHLGGRFGVTLFFVISGYIMVVTTGQGGFDPVRFMRRRLLRVAPLYYVATAVAALAALAIPWAFKDTVIDLRHIVSSLLFVPMYEPGSSGQITPFLKLGWTLNYEIFFYVVFACLAAVGAWSRAVALTVVFGALVGLGLVFDFPWAPAQFYTRIVMIAFVAGVWIAVLARPDAPSLPVPLAMAGLGVSAVSLGAMAVMYVAVETRLMTEFWLVGTCALIVLCLSRAPEAWTRAAPPVLAYLGDASYAIYLFHMFAVGLTYVLVRKFVPEGLNLPALWPAVVAAASGVGVGLTVHRLIETPMTAALAPLHGPKPPVGTPPGA